MKRAIEPGHAAAPAGPYSQAVRWGDLVFLSGQVPRDPDTGEMAAGTVAEQAEQMLQNVGALLDAAGLGFADVVKTTLFLTSMDDFAEVNAAYARHFPAPYPARSTVAVSALPLGARMEIDCMAAAGTRP